MGRETIRIRRVGSVTFGLVLIITGVLGILQIVFPQVDYQFVLHLWPLILILLGVEVLLGSRQKNVEILDENGRIIEQSKLVYDVPAILLTVVLTGFSLCMGVMDWILTSQAQGRGIWY